MPPNATETPTSAADVSPPTPSAAETPTSAADVSPPTPSAAETAAAQAQQEASAAFDARFATERPKAGTRAERKWIKKERKKLRKELKEKGITSREDFEQIAHELGLVLDGGRLAALWRWWRLGLLSLFSNLGLGTLLAAAAAALAGLFLLSVITENAGSFTINLTADMMQAGFVLSETSDFDDVSVRLQTEEIKEVTNITLEDISTVVTSVDGNFAADNYLAYTFYIKNTGSEATGYTYTLTQDDEILDVSKAVWIMFFEDDRQMIYAQMSDDGNPEELYGFTQAPFGEHAYDYDAQYYYEDGFYGLVTTAYATDEIVVQGYVDALQPGETKKYTIVIWLEGYDPECTNDLFGGYAKYSIEFDKAETDFDAGIFSGVYRTEYQDYIDGLSATP